MQPPALRGFDTGTSAFPATIINAVATNAGAANAMAEGHTRSRNAGMDSPAPPPRLGRCPIAVGTGREGEA